MLPTWEPCLWLECGIYIMILPDKTVDGKYCDVLLRLIISTRFITTKLSKHPFTSWNQTTCASWEKFHYPCSREWRLVKWSGLNVITGERRVYSSLLAFCRVILFFTPLLPNRAAPWGFFFFFVVFFSLSPFRIVLCLVFGVFWHEQHWSLSGQGTFTEHQMLFRRNCILVVAFRGKKENKSTFFYPEVEASSLGRVFSSTVEFLVFPFITV